MAQIYKISEDYLGGPQMFQKVHPWINTLKKLYDYKDLSRYILTSFPTLSFPQNKISTFNKCLHMSWKGPYNELM